MLEDLEEDEKEELEALSEALKAKRRQKMALDWRMKLELDKTLDPDAPPE